MIILAIETATLDVAAALVEDNEVRAAFTERGARRHIETLHPGIERLFSETGRTAADVEAVVVDIGPGLFTGLRVGIAAAKAFAAALELPIVGLTSTEVLAAGAMRSGYSGAVPVVDMRRGDVAWTTNEGTLVLGTPVELAATLLATTPSGQGVVLVGDGAARHDEALRKSLIELDGGLIVVGDELLAPPVAVLGALGYEKLAAGGGEGAFDLAPLYLREADARANFAIRDEVGTR